MMDTPANFHALESRLRLSGELVTCTGLHIGTGEGEAAGFSDKPVLRDAEGFPFIPGASLKGAIRSSIEGLIRAIQDRSSGLWACDPLVSRPREDGEHACGAHEPGERDAVAVEAHCCICRLLGSHVLASHVRFSDAHVVERGGWAPIELRDGVAIDRDLGTVHGNLKYDFEVVSPGTRFSLEVFVENPEPWLLGLLAVGFDQLSEGFTALGGFGSRGLGRVVLAWSELHRFTAEGLLAGEEPEIVKGDGLEREFEGWRQKLADRAERRVR